MTGDIVEEPPMLSSVLNDDSVTQSIRLTYNAWRPRRGTSDVTKPLLEVGPNETGQKQAEKAQHKHFDLFSSP